MKNNLKVMIAILQLSMILAGCSESKKQDASERGLSLSDSATNENKGAKIIVVESVLSDLWQGITQFSADTLTAFTYQDSLFWSHVSDQIPSVEILLNNEKYLIKKQPVKNSYIPKDIDTLLLCSDATSGNYFEYYFTKNQNNMLKLFAHVKTSEYEFPDGIKAGMTLKELLKKIKLEKEENNIKKKSAFQIKQYSEMAILQFLIKNDTVTEINLFIPVD